MASLSAMYALYQVSVRQATISLSLLLAHTSRCKPWESLWGSSATTPLVDFHHRLTACPSYKERAARFCEPLFLHFPFPFFSIFLFSYFPFFRKTPTISCPKPISPSRRYTSTVLSGEISCRRFSIRTAVWCAAWPVSGFS